MLCFKQRIDGYFLMAACYFDEFEHVKNSGYFANLEQVKKFLQLITTKNLSQSARRCG